MALWEALLIIAMWAILTVALVLGYVWLGHSHINLGQLSAFIGIQIASLIGALLGFEVIKRIPAIASTRHLRSERLRAEQEARWEKEKLERYARLTIIAKRAKAQRLAQIADE